MGLYSKVGSKHYKTGRDKMSFQWFTGRSYFFRKAVCRLLLVLVPLLLASSAAFAQVQYVQPVDWSRYSGMMGVQPADAFGQKVVTLMQNQSKYLFGWIDDECSKSYSDGQYAYNPKWGESFRREEDGIRPLAQFARTNVVMIKTGVYSAAASGISQDEALERTRMAIRGVALTHCTFKPTDNWGDNWQSAYWTSMFGEAAWMAWGDLSSSTQAAVAKVVEYESNRFINYKVHYWKNPDGSTNYPGDSKSEENSWNARVLAVAQAMMPNHPNVSQWREKASELVVGSYCRPSDLTNTTLVDGKPVKDWINGYNIHEDGVVINHNQIHPDYNLTVLCLANAITCSLANQYVPQSTYFNADVVYNALTSVEFTPPSSPHTDETILAPGGTMYKKSMVDGVMVYDPNVYFPNGTDWFEKRYESYATEDIFAEMLGFDEGEDFDSMGWAHAHIDGQLALQSRPGHTGNLYEDGEWVNDWYPKEAQAYKAAGNDWILWWLMQNGQVAPVGDHWGAVPEPGTLCLLGALAGGLIVRWRWWIFWGRSRRGPHNRR